jgi:hypothetical protein
MRFDQDPGPRGENTARQPAVERGLLHWLAPWRKPRAQPATPEDTVAAHDGAEPSPAGTRSRAGEDPRQWFRCDRIFFQNGGWYIATREGIDVGPYANAAAARRDEKQLIKLLTRSSGNGFSDQALIIRQFVNRPRHGH